MDNNVERKGFLYSTFIGLGLVYLGVFGSVLFSGHNIVVKGIFIYLALCNLLCFYRSSLLDPGFLDNSNYMNFELQPLHFKSTLDVVPDAFGNIRTLYFTETCEEGVDNKTSPKHRGTINYIQKYCTTCNVFRPYKAAHCNDCGRCVQGKDHHCLWLDNCIGRNNSKVFLCFLTTTLIINSYCCFTFYKLLKMEMEVHRKVSVYIAFFFYITLGFFLFTFWCYNTFLALLDIKSRALYKPASTLAHGLDFKKVWKRLCTLSPVVIIQKNAI